MPLPWLGVFKYINQRLSCTKTCPRHTDSTFVTDTQIKHCRGTKALKDTRDYYYTRFNCFSCHPFRNPKNSIFTNTMFSRVDMTDVYLCIVLSGNIVGEQRSKDLQRSHLPSSQRKPCGKNLFTVPLLFSIRLTNSKILCFRCSKLEYK